MAESGESLPKSLQGRVSSRGTTILAFATTLNAVNDPEFPDVSSDEPLRAGLLTNAGQIIGDIFLGEPGLIHKTIQVLRNNTITESELQYGDRVELSGSSAHIVIRNAILIPWSASGSKFTYDELTIFVDDIIGFTAITKTSTI